MKSHNKKCIIYFIAGAMIFGTVGAFAGQYIATENTFPVQLNGKDVAVDGYNIVAVHILNFAILQMSRRF